MRAAAVSERIVLTHRLGASSPETLLYYDGPVLFWLPVAGRRLLAYALDDCPPVKGEPFIVSELDEDLAARVNAGRASLREIVLSAHKHYLLADYTAADELLLLPLATPLPEAWLPGA